MIGLDKDGCLSVWSDISVGGDGRSGGVVVGVGDGIEDGDGDGDGVGVGVGVGAGVGLYCLKELVVILISRSRSGQDGLQGYTELLTFLFYKLKTFELAG